MTNDAYLPHQLETLQPPLMKKKSNLIFIASIIPLLLANLQYLDFLLSQSARPIFSLGDSFIGTAPHLSALLATDLVTASLYFGERSNTNWKVIFILLFICNLISFGSILIGINHPFFVIGLLGAFPYFSILSVLDFIAVFIKKHPHGGRAWIKSYTALLVVSLVLFLLGIFIFQFSAFGLIPKR